MIPISSTTRSPISHKLKPRKRPGNFKSSLSPVRSSDTVRLVTKKASPLRSMLHLIPSSEAHRTASWLLVRVLLLEQKHRMSPAVGKEWQTVPVAVPSPNPGKYGALSFQRCLITCTFQAVRLRSGHLGTPSCLVHSEDSTQRSTQTKLNFLLPLPRRVG